MNRTIVIVIIIALAGLILWQILKNLRRMQGETPIVTPAVSTPVTTPIIVVTPPVSNIGKGIYSKGDNVNVWKGGGPVVYKVVNKDDFIGTLKKEDTQWYYSVGTTGEEIFVTKVNSYLK